MAAQKQRRLGRGLSGLIQGGIPTQVGPGPGTDTNENTGVSRASDNSRPEDTGLVRLVAVGDIRPSGFQPRRSFDEASLAQLAVSIARAGLMQPIIVRPGGDGGYELVAGERRWRAARLAGLTAVPAVVRALADEDAAEWALVENIQREDLNPMERAHGLRGLAERFGLSHAQLGERVGLDRSTVANLIRMTELEEQVQALVVGGALQMGHARALLGMSAGAARRALAERAASGAWSVRQVEAAVRAGSSQTRQQQQNTTPTQREAIIADIERRLSAHLGTRVRVSLRAGGARGRVVVDFFSLEEFEGMMERMGLGDEAGA